MEGEFHYQHWIKRNNAIISTSMELYNVPVITKAQRSETRYLHIPWWDITKKAMSTCIEGGLTFGSTVAQSQVVFLSTVSLFPNDLVKYCSVVYCFMQGWLPVAPWVTPLSLSVLLVSQISGPLRQWWECVCLCLCVRVRASYYPARHWHIQMVLCGLLWGTGQFPPLVSLVIPLSAVKRNSCCLCDLKTSLWATRSCYRPDKYRQTVGALRCLIRICRTFYLLQCKLIHWSNRRFSFAFPGLGGGGSSLTQTSVSSVTFPLLSPPTERTRLGGLGSVSSFFGWNVNHHHFYMLRASHIWVRRSNK